MRLSILPIKLILLSSVATTTIVLSSETTDTSSSHVAVLFSFHIGVCTQLKPFATVQPHRLLTSAHPVTFEAMSLHVDPKDTESMTTITSTASSSSLATMFLGTAVSNTALEVALDHKCFAGRVLAYSTTQLQDYVTSIKFQTRVNTQAQRYRSVDAYLKAVSARTTQDPIVAAPSEVIVKLVDSGPPANRLDVVLMGDGYTAQEELLFFDDMQRMTNTMFNAATFAPYLPLFNIWALFRPSVESGLGTGGKAKDTAFGLYRAGTELRGVYCSNKWAARRACEAVGPMACDFPSLIANDPFYGGLGGEFTISTASRTSGSMVLRHEMGHNFGQVGEEYDGGQVYNGANSDTSRRPVSWEHWLTDITTIESGRVENSALLLQKYPWIDLSQASVQMTFTSTGTYASWRLYLSVSNMTSSKDFAILLDGTTPLSWVWNGERDRSIYHWEFPTGLSKGQHTLRFTTSVLASSMASGLRQLCNVAVTEYGTEATYRQQDRHAIGLYPTYNSNGGKSYRPNDAKCLMRNMTSTEFCVVCEENMWLKFLARVSLIDALTISDTALSLTVLPLAQWRAQDDAFRSLKPSIVAAERLTIKWYRQIGSMFNKSWERLEVLENRLTLKTSELLELDDLMMTSMGQYKVEVTFTTPMIRKDPSQLSTSTKTFRLA